MSGKERTEHLKSIKPYGSLWVKEGMSAEQKRKDSWDCDALPIADAENRPTFSDEKLRAAKRPEDPNDIAAEGRVYKVWTECMKTKGYERLQADK